MSADTIKVCIVEDNTPIRKLFKTLLSKSGFEVFDFSDGGSGLEWLKNNTVDLIILDILLPDINGTDLMQSVRAIEAHKNIAMVAITGFASTQDKEKFIELGFDAYLSKPINTATFVDDMKKLIK